MVIVERVVWMEGTLRTGIEVVRVRGEERHGRVRSLRRVWTSKGVEVGARVRVFHQVPLR